MDGVLVDFDKGYKDLTGIDIKNQFRSDSEFWEPISKAGYGFWINLKWMSDGYILWDFIKKYNPELLSAPSRDNSSRVGKIDWVKRELPGIKLHLRSAKYKKEFASPNSILIDDRLENIESWAEAGGIGILHKSAKETINILKTQYGLK